MNGAMLLVPISSDEAARLELQPFDRGPHMYQGRAEHFIRLVFVLHPLQRRRCIKKIRRIAFFVGFLFVYTSDIFFIYGRYARVQIFVGDVLSLH